MSDPPAAMPPARHRPLRVGVVSLGCAKNLVDTEVMLGHLDHAGCTFVQDPSEADVILVNTCAFIEEAREESIQAILEAAEHKKAGQVQKLIVAGCMVQRYPEEMRRQLPEVDGWLDLDELDLVTERVGAGPVLASDLPLVSSNAPPVPAVRRPSTIATAGAPWSPARFLYDDRTPRKRATPPWSAYVKIAEGCDHTCSFCAIPSFRGSFRSREPDSLVREAEALARAGVREINLIAQDSSHYGRDLGLTEGLADLLERLDGVGDLRWIRLHYLYPNTITQNLIERMARLARVVGYVDLPLQHAHRDTLRRMRRGGEAATHLSLLDRFRTAMPDAALRTTLIVGFPGETEREFEALLAFIAEARFDHLGVFTYSHEEGTTARELADDVPAKVKRDRRRRVMQLQRRIVRERLAAAVGRRVEVLVEGAHPETEHLLVGRMSTQAADVDGQVLLNDGAAEPGSFVQVQLTGTAGYDLVGEIVGPA